MRRLNKEEILKMLKNHENMFENNTWILLILILSMFKTHDNIEELNKFLTKLKNNKYEGGDDLKK